MTIAGGVAGVRRGGTAVKRKLLLPPPSYLWHKHFLGLIQSNQINSNDIRRSLEITRQDSFFSEHFVDIKEALSEV